MSVIIYDSTLFSKKDENREYTSWTAWKRVTVILETINLCSDGDNFHKLVPLLFTLLLWCFEAKELDKSSHKDNLEYTMQMILSSLLRICTSINEKGVQNAQGMLVCVFGLSNCFKHLK